LCALVGVDDGEDFGNGFTEVVDLCELGCRTAGDLLDAQLTQLGLQLAQLLLQVLLVLGPQRTGLDFSGRHFE